MNYLAGERDPSRPFCMVISVEPPHDPFEAPPDIQAAWEAREIELPSNFEASDDARREALVLDRKRYYAMVENLDANVKRMTDFLEAQGLAENTVVMFVSDHGELGGSHGLRGKQWPYEESVGIPAIVYDPRFPRRAGAMIEDPICTEDFFPTLLGLAGLAPGEHLMGTDLSALIHGEIDSLDREGVLLEFVAELRKGMAFNQWVWRAFRSRRYKYTVRPDTIGPGPSPSVRPSAAHLERRNLIDHPNFQDEIARHHRLLRERLVETGDHFVLLPAFGCEGVNLWR